MLILLLFNLNFFFYVFLSLWKDCLFKNMVLGILWGKHNWGFPIHMLGLCTFEQNFLGKLSYANFWGFIFIHEFISHVSIFILSWKQIDRFSFWRLRLRKIISNLFHPQILMWGSFLLNVLSWWWIKSF